MFGDSLTLGTTFGLIVFLVLFIFITPIKKFKNKNEKSVIRGFYINKLVWFFFICLAIYYAFTIPYVGKFYQSDSDLPRPNSSAQNIDHKEYLLDYYSRIEDLENELSETKTELREFRENYRGVYLVILIGVIMFGGIQIFGVSKEEWLNKHKSHIEE